MIQTKQKWTIACVFVVVSFVSTLSFVLASSGAIPGRTMEEAKANLTRLDSLYKNCVVQQPNTRWERIGHRAGNLKSYLKNIKQLRNFEVRPTTELMDEAYTKLGLTGIEVDVQVFSDRDEVYVFHDKPNKRYGALAPRIKKRLRLHTLRSLVRHFVEQGYAERGHKLYIELKQASFLRPLRKLTKAQKRLLRLTLAELTKELDRTPRGRRAKTSGAFGFASFSLLALEWMASQPQGKFYPTHFILGSNLPSFKLGTVKKNLTRNRHLTGLWFDVGLHLIPRLRPFLQKLHSFRKQKGWAPLRVHIAVYKRKNKFKALKRSYYYRHLCKKYPKVYTQVYGFIVDIKGDDRNKMTIGPTRTFRSDVTAKAFASYGKPRKWQRACLGGKAKACEKLRRAKERSRSVYFRRYRMSYRPYPKRLQRCVLFHGYGVEDGKLRPLDCHVGQRGCRKEKKFQNFVSRYYSSTFFRRLLQKGCNELIVVMQESVLSTMLEMTQRSEAFLREVGCPEHLKKGQQCAVFGHSKGGAVVYHMARRCMQKKADSRLQKSACLRIAEFYSAAGVIQGTASVFVLRGAWLCHKNNPAQKCPTLTTKERRKLWILQQMTTMMHRFYRPITQPYRPPQSSPLWANLNPGAPMEAQLPLYAAGRVALYKQGWLRADYAASAGNFHFRGKGFAGPGPCRKHKDYFRPKGHNYYHRKWACNLAFLHHSRWKSAFQIGKQDALRILGQQLANTKEPAQQQALHTTIQGIKSLTWTDSRTGDGMATYKLSLQSCLSALNKHKKTSHSSTPLAVQSCRSFPFYNHRGMAGGAPGVQEHVLQQFLR